MFRQPIRGRRRQRRTRLRVTNRDTSQNLSEDTNLSPVARLKVRRLGLSHQEAPGEPHQHCQQCCLPPCCSSASPAGGALISRGWSALNSETERVCHGSYQRRTVTAESTIDQGKRDFVPRRDSQTKSPPLNQIGCS